MKEKKAQLNLLASHVYCIREEKINKRKEEHNKMMMKDVITYFSITTKSKVTDFDDESIPIQFMSPLSLV